MRREDRALTSEAALALLEMGEYGILSTVGEKGQPYGVPVSYAIMDDQIIFHSAMEGHKIENFTSCDRVSFCVVGKTKVLPEAFSTNYESTIVFGVVRELFDGEKLKGLKALVAKYSPGLEHKGNNYIQSSMGRTAVFGITMEQVTGKARNPA